MSKYTRYAQHVADTNTIISTRFCGSVVGEEDWGEFVQNLGAVKHHLVCHCYKPY